MDINPITTQRTGTLETYLLKVEEYLDGVREARVWESCMPDSTPAERLEKLAEYKPLA